MNEKQQFLTPLIGSSGLKVGIKQKNRLIKAFVMALWMPLTATVAAGDFSSYSTEELFQMRDQARYMSEEDKDAYRAERQSRMAAMSQEERQAMRDGNEFGGRNRSDADQGQGTKTRSRLRDGSGGGSGKRRGGGGRH